MRAIALRRKKLQKHEILAHYHKSILKYCTHWDSLYNFVQIKNHLFQFSDPKVTLEYEHPLVCPLLNIELFIQIIAFLVANQG